MTKLRAPGQAGINDASGLNNIGILVCTTGRVTGVDGTDFWLDDGSGVIDDSGNYGIKVSTYGLATMPQRDQYVKVFGISSSMQSGGNTYRLIKATSVVIVR